MVILTLRLAGEPEGRITRPSMTALFVSEVLYLVSTSMSCARAGAARTEQKPSTMKARCTLMGFLSQTLRHDKPCAGKTKRRERLCRPLAPNTDGTAQLKLRTRTSERIL